jgi:hypothetical protein
MGGLI